MSEQKIPLCKLFSSLLLMASLGLFLLSCSEEPPIRVGFVGGLTGRVADLGVAGRDAVVLAVEEKNQSGGIAGRKLELMVRDDRQVAEGAKLAVQELAEAQVVAIIGPMTSAMGVVLQPLINEAKIVTVSPTVKTDKLSGLDDFFFRVTTPLSRNAEKVADYAANNLGLKKFAVVYDRSNLAFTETWLNFFKTALQASGGEISLAESFSDDAADGVHFLPIAERIVAAAPEGVLLLSNAIDTALLAQQIRKLQCEVPLFTSEWASTTDLFSFGGRAVNGMISFHSFNAGSQEADYLVFKEKFVKRFGAEPSFATVLAYDAANYLFAGLEMNQSRTALKDSLLKIETFPGLQSDITVDRFGDVDRKLFLTVIENGQFKVVE